MNWAELGIAAGRWALFNSAGAALIVILVLIIQTTLGDRISPRWRHNLWLLVVARLILPAIPAIQLPLPHWPQTQATVAVTLPSPSKELPKAIAAPTNLFVESNHFDVDNWHSLQVAAEPVSASTGDFTQVTADPAPASATEAVIISSKPLLTTVSFPQSDNSQALPKRSFTIPWRTLLPVAWLLGAVLVAAGFLLSTLRLRFITRRFNRVDDPHVLDLLTRCTQLLGLKRSPILVSGPQDFGPALVGLLRPRLVVPQLILTNFSEQELRSVFLHELVHYRRRDVAMNYLLAALTALHWFNPLVWLAFARLRAERELACDQAVMKLSPPRERLAYGCTILKLLELAGRGPQVPAAAVGVIGNKGLMQRRIAMIARFDRRPSNLSFTAAALSLVVAGATLTAPTFAQDKPAPIPTRPEAAPAVDQARRTIDAAAAEPKVPTSTAPQPPTALDPLAPPPVATTPTAPLSMETAAQAPLPIGAAVAEPPPPTEPRRADVFSGASRSIEDASASAADAKTMERLRQSHPLSSQGAPLRDVLRQIADIGKLDIVTDDKALSSELDAAINLSVHEPRPLEQLLEMSLRLSGPQADYSVLNGVIFVSSRGELNSRIVTRVYDVGNADHDAITDLLINGSHLVPRVSYVGTKLVVTASELTQRHVAKLLSAVSDQMSQHRVGQASRGTSAQETTLHALRFADPQTVAQVLGSACSPNIRVVIDPRTNSIVVTGSQDDQSLAAKIISKLDQPAGEKGAPLSADETVAKLRSLAEAAIKISERYGANSKQLEDVAKQVDAVGTEASKWIDRLAKDGNLPAAEKLRSELQQIKDLLAPLAKEVQSNRPPEVNR